MPRPAPKTISAFRELRAAWRGGGIDLRELGMAILRRWGGPEKFADAMFKALDEKDTTYSKPQKVQIMRILVGIVSSASRINHSEHVDFEQMTNEDIEQTLMQVMRRIPVDGA